MMNNKNNKNTLLQSVAYGPHADFMALRLKASFHASPAAIMALLAKHRLHQSKNTALRAEKPIFATKTITKTNTFLWFKSSMVNYVDFCHDSANQASLMAFAAPKVQEMFFSEAMFLLSRTWNHVSGCEKWCGLGVEACLYRQGHNTLHESSMSFKAEERVFQVFVTYNK